MTNTPSLPAPGRCVSVAKGVRRILADNPSAFTGPGTNSYLIGHGEVALIDPGPADPAHLKALLDALAPGERITHIIVTHPHRDHSALAPALSNATKAPVLAFGTCEDGLNPAYATFGDLGGGEGTDHDFIPDIRCRDGEEISGPGWSLQVIHTPGHLGSHIALKFGSILFSGDHVMGWSSSIVSPPEGDMGAYMRALERLLSLDVGLLLPGHGAEVPDGPARIRELQAHRRLRESQILSALTRESGSAEELARRIYQDLAPGLLPAATRNVLAHLLDLQERKEISAHPAPSRDAIWKNSSRN